MTAGIAAALAAGESAVSALQLGVAAGAANVTRRGLATAQRDLIEKLVGQERICRLKIQARLTDEGAGHQ
jgi:1-phosphofructokinase